MKPRPTLKSLRVGQTLYRLDAAATCLLGRPVLWLCFIRSNGLRRRMQNNAYHYLASEVYASRRQAMSAGRRVLAAYRARQRDRAFDFLRDAARVSACLQLFQALPYRPPARTDVALNASAI